MRHINVSYYYYYYLCAGRAGVNALWGTLRDDSTVKLQKADSKIPQELKAAYGAFVRECLTHNKTVAKRSFYSEEGVRLNDGF